MESFADRIAANLTTKHWDSSVFPSLGTVNNRLGNPYFNGSTLHKEFVDTIDGYTSISFGMAINVGTNFNGSSTFIQLNNATGTAKLSFKISNDGRVGFYIEGDAAGYRALSAPLYALHPGTWYYIAVSAHLTPPDPEDLLTHWLIDLTVWIDGVAAINVAGVDLGINALTDLSIFKFDLKAGGDVNTSHGVSDFYIRGGLVLDALNEKFKAPRICVLRPNADGASSEFPVLEPTSPTTHYTKVDEDTENQIDFVQATDETCTPPVTDTFSLTDIPTVITSSSKKTLAAQFSFSNTATSDSDLSGGHNVLIHVVNTEEDEFDVSGGGYNSVYIEETALFGGFPPSIGDANGLDSGARVKFVAA